MLTPKIPRSEYALSSGRVVSRLAAPLGPGSQSVGICFTSKLGELELCIAMSKFCLLFPELGGVVFLKSKELT
jgi:hypothetical protein